MTIAPAPSSRRDHASVRDRQRAEKRPVGWFTLVTARGFLLWAQAWPSILAITAPAMLFFILSLFGLWRAVATPVHWLGIVATGLATLFAMWRTAPRWRIPSEAAALARIEADSGMTHAPLQAIADAPFNAEDTNPLWRAHLTAMRERAKNIKLAGPFSDASAIDPMGLRYVAPGLLVVALVAAGDDRAARLSHALNPSAVSPLSNALVDLWIDPPAYTGKAPIFLLRAGEPHNGLAQQVNAPRGARVIAQLNGGDKVTMLFDTGDEKIAGEIDADEQSAGAQFQTARRVSLIINQSGALRFRYGGVQGVWPIGALPDTQPHVRFVETPARTDDARLAFSIAAEDDYGVEAAFLSVRLDPDQKRPLDAPAIDQNALQSERRIPLDNVAAHGGAQEIALDLTNHPWAGLKVIGAVIVRDGAGQEATSDPQTFTLPARNFFNPLARSVIEQRQTLAIAPSQWRRAGRSFDALTFAPQAFYDRSTDYLLLRTAFWRVMREAGQDVDKTVDDFWPLALQLEDETLELARLQLEAAGEALRQALESNASDAEITRLVEELREAMANYIEALAQSGGANAQADAQNAQALEQGDLDDMLDSIRDLSQSGARGAARSALSDLQNLLDNLRLGGQSASAGQQGQSQSGGQNSGQAGSQSGPGAPNGRDNNGASAAGDLIGQQRELANRSYQQSLSSRPQGDALSNEQRGLADDLQDIRDRLAGGDANGANSGENGGALADPNGDAGRAFDEAAGQMRRAEDALRAGDFAAAGSAMERAISSLRSGAQALADANEADGESGERAAGTDGQSGPAVDPLGRPVSPSANDGTGVDVPDQDAYRDAREVLMELRRRLSDGERSQEEIEYLERLLERF